MSKAGRSDYGAMRGQRREAYLASFRKHVHTLLCLGYSRLNRSSLATRDEPVITGELVREMHLAMEEDDAPAWAKRYSLREDPPLNVRGRLGKDRPRVDIEFERIQRGPRPRYHWEAKRLRDSSSTSAYLGQYGLGRYLDGIYGVGHAEAGMLGYVQAEDEQTWAGRIDERLQDEPHEYRIVKDGDWTRVVIVDELLHSYRTRHSRGRGRPQITIYHALLRLC